MAKQKQPVPLVSAEYEQLSDEISSLLETARRQSARAVNAVLTATYWEVGRRIVEFEQSGSNRAEYGEELLQRLGADLSKRFGTGYSPTNLYKYRQFYLCYPVDKILPTLSVKLGNAEILPTVSGKSGGKTLQTLSEKSPEMPALFDLTVLMTAFPLPWSAYVRLLSVKNEAAREFYETEALRGGWSVRQLDRQIQSQFYERTALSRNKAAMLKKGAVAKPEDIVTPEEEIKDPFVLEFLGLKDEYSESELEEALIRHLETFLLELGSGFTFVARQRRLRIGDSWYKMDLVLYHRRLRCLVIVDLKLGAFSHADAGQMHVYLNYAREQMMLEGENPPVGLILCAEKDEALAKYALEGLPNKVMAAEYQTTLPDEKLLVAELEKTRRQLELQAQPRNASKDNS